MTFIFKIAISDNFEVFIVIFTVFIVLNFSSLKMSAERKSEEDFKILNKDWFLINKVINIRSLFIFWSVSLLYLKSWACIETFSALEIIAESLSVKSLRDLRSSVFLILFKVRIAAVSSVFALKVNINMI